MCARCVQMSLYVIHCLGAYQHAKCNKGRITNSEDFKYVARKVCAQCHVAL